MDGMLEIAEDIFQMPVRKGVPSSSARSGGHEVTLAEGGFCSVIADPKFATGVGLVLFGAAHEPMAADPTPRRPTKLADTPGIGRRFVGWVREMF
jgi:cell division protein FtsA